jgi:hypothetical protein
MNFATAALPEGKAKGVRRRQKEIEKRNKCSNNMACTHLKIKYLTSPLSPQGIQQKHVDLVLPQELHIFLKSLKQTWNSHKVQKQFREGSGTGITEDLGCEVGTGRKERLPAGHSPGVGNTEALTRRPKFFGKAASRRWSLYRVFL